MTDLPHLHPNWRSPRARLADVTPAVLRLPDGRRSRGKLETISLTGGLLNVTQLLDRGSQFSLMFLTQAGAVVGEAEMLSPVSNTKQPFRFVAIEEDDHRRLRTAVQSVLDTGEQEWIEKYRTALAAQRPPRRGFLRAILGVATLLALCVGSIYFFHLHLLK
jgi:hypothetical protein